jgi:hypothetical protein
MVPWACAAVASGVAMGPALTPDPSPLEFKMELLKTKSPAPPSPEPPAKANENTFEPWELVSV